jgi:membrane protein
MISPSDVPPPTAFRLLGHTVRSFRKHDGALLSGALAFYSLLAMAPLFIFAVAIAGIVLGHEAAEGELEAERRQPPGAALTGYVLRLIDATSRPGPTWMATALGVAFLLYASTRLFTKLQSALNLVWGVRVLAEKHNVGKVLAKRLVSFVMVVGFGVWVVILLLAKTALSVATGALGAIVDSPGLWHVLEFAISVTVYALLVVSVFKVLPDVRISFWDTARGAALTAFMLGLGKQAIGFYLGYASPASAYGAAGSLVVLLLWLYYTLQIFILGAEFTGIYARARGSGIRPRSYAMRIVEEQAATANDSGARMTYPERDGAGGREPLEE